MKKEQATIRKGFTTVEGPFVKALDDALASFNVERKVYHGGTFVGNHVHRSLKVQNLILDKTLL